jgi:hypothetical protein
VAAIADSAVLGEFGSVPQGDDHAACRGGFKDGHDAAVATRRTDSTLVHIDGCFSSDADWDAQSYRNDWPGTDRNVARDRALHPSPVLFTSPRTDGRN